MVIYSTFELRGLNFPVHTLSWLLLPSSDKYMCFKELHCVLDLKTVNKSFVDEDVTRVRVSVTGKSERLCF